MKSRMTAWMATLLMSSFAFSDYTGVLEDGYWRTLVDTDGTEVSAYVVDLYAITDDLSNSLISMQIMNMSHPGTYIQTQTGVGWKPRNFGSTYDSAALRNIDSFVTIGGGFVTTTVDPPKQTPGLGSTTELSPLFGGNVTLIPDTYGEWYDSIPADQAGIPQFCGRIGLFGTFIGRFSFNSEFSLEGSTLRCIWYYGPGTDPGYEDFIVGGGVDACPYDPNKTEPGTCGCGNEDTDTDGDGTANCIDNCPDDPNKTEPGVCGCGNEDTDTDGDGTADCVDNCPDDPDKTEPGFCGCGTVDTNVNGDVDCDGDFDEDDALAAVKLFGLDKDECPADVDGDGSIGFSDVLIILNDWGACP